MREIKCLDHGHVKLLDMMGSDRAIVEAARLSYDQVRPQSEDRALIRYLMRSGHTSPFEMAEIKIECKMPIFVARQWVRHRTASINEVSARYTELPGEFYIPDVLDLQPQASSNKQGREGALSEEQASAYRAAIHQHSRACFATYQEMLGRDDAGNDAVPGMARELARMVLPLNVYTRWVWKIDVNNLLKFLKLRLDPHAQKEIRVFAEAIARIVKWWLPLTWEAFEDYILNAVTFSAQELRAISHMMSYETTSTAFDLIKAGIDHAELTGREADEFRKKMEKLK